MEQMSLFEMEDAGVQLAQAPCLQVVKSRFVQAENVSWQELFEGFDEIYGITFSSGIRFMAQLLDRFDYAEVIFGCEGLVEDGLAAIMAVERALVEQLTKDKAALKMCGQMEADSLKLWVSRDVKSHEKVFCLKAKDGRTRVITGSANLSASAFGGLQRENITYYDDVEAYHWYKSRYDAFRESCADHVSHEALMRTIADDEYLEEHPEEIPILKTIEKRNIVIIEKSEEENEDAELVVSVRGLEAELKPMLPKVKKSEKKIVLTAEQTRSFCRNHREFRAEKKEKRKKLPKLHMDYDTGQLVFNGKVCNLHPEPEQIRSDIRHLLGFLSGLEDFHGKESEKMQAKKNYYAFLNWYFASLFMPYLRYNAHYNGYDVTAFPVVGVVYGESNGGKSTFLRLLSKLMCNVKIPLNASQDFTASNMEDLRRGCEGVPLIVDDLDRTQFQNHAGKIVKDDEWGIRDHFIHYPAIAITTNKLPSLEAPLSKRIIGCRINIKIGKEAGVKNAKKLNESMRSVTNSLYCEYVRRMLPGVNELVEQMKQGDEEYFPDILCLSSTVLNEIIREYLPDEIPDYFTNLSYWDCFGEKVVGYNAIGKILNAWENERKQFQVIKKRNRLVYTYPDGANTYDLRYICDELPPRLNAKVASRSLVMDLDQAEDFFGVRFRRW